jgi:predicted PolB exonuclease-like 3'-5' exonuclease
MTPILTFDIETVPDVSGMRPILTFDIETVPDVSGMRRLYSVPDDLPDAEVAEVAFQKRRAVSNNDFLPPHLHRVLVISCVLRDDDGVRVFSIGEPESGEAAAIQRFSRASTSSSRRSCRGTDATSTCRCWSRAA